MDLDGWLQETEGVRGYYADFGDRVPRALLDELAALEERLRAAR